MADRRQTADPEPLPEPAPAAGPQPLLRVNAVTHRLGGAESTPVLRDVSLLLPRVQVLALAGRSGSGKSTLCHLVAGLGHPESGQITLDGRPCHDITDWAVISLLPQRLALVGELSVAENILLPALLRDRRPVEEAQRLTAALGLDAIASRPATETSLGEQQRAALARALVLDPRLAVLDEPTGHQDDDHVELVLTALVEARRRGTAVLVATHDERVLAVADQVIRLHRGQVLDSP